ncbi:nitrate- and nitrite sensing domain-containing protein [Kordiimonas lacus]|uniref:cAMP-binding domain of CRP or a regulatory subunit of cAMP-dependent protein kinases n=1 Tax=Kordiimonas lacus TaxID=637679 RepID=A0A1G7ABA5_9PROT|nr:nitrate- and nitrite sensing domain-containing protein [Kordiimonas lacus]SDE11156.1 cAMP-binding domain of CRP or a regulatory subunit of cAMP-dependent protein kinases [Kordiimonas lacus]
MNTPVQNTRLVQDLLHKLGDVVHQIQRERGCAGLLLDSLGKIFARRYDEQNKAVDKAINDLRTFCGRTDVKDALPQSFEARLAFLLRKFEELTEVRDQIRLMKVRYTQALNNYTFKFTVPTIDAMIELAQREPRHNSALVSAYSNFLQWKERVGMERALGARGFYTFSFRNQEFCDRFVALIAEQRTYFDTFKALASPSQITVLQEAVQDTDLRALGKINDLLEEGAPPGEIEQYSGETWFELLTRMIDGLRKAEITLVNGLEGALKAEATGNANDVTSGKMAQYRPFLKSLPMLAALADGDLDELLSLSQIREYEKDKLLFLRDEPAARMYVILEGWVKAYNGLETGEEAILQMLGAGETLLESAVFLNMPTPVNAQVVERATLLSIPAPVIRQRIHSSPQLAVNMLNTVSLRSQRLVQQLELSRLKSAQERVGWFLLRLALNQKSSDGTILLPYEKSIIASYLDMRPETFSRTLKKFKEEGFRVATDHVVMPDADSLCDFCDVELAGQCGRSQTDDCPRPELSEMAYQTDS